MADYLKLFHSKRLTAAEPHHLEFIKGRLANLKFEDPRAYDEFSAFYGVDIEAKVTKEPKAKTVTAKKDEPKASLSSTDTVNAKKA
jgi:hypothetical protein